MWDMVSTRGGEISVFIDVQLSVCKFLFKDIAAHFNRDPVVISKGIKGLQKKIREDERIATAINMLRESLTKNRKRYLFS